MGGSTTVGLARSDDSKRDSFNYFFFIDLFSWCLGFLGALCILEALQIVGDPPATPQEAII
jgi:hypothetical protein